MQNLLTYTIYFFIFFTTLWFGNFLTSFYFRIPRSIPLNGKTNPPMCSTCNIKLKYPDYGPLFYYLFKGRACKICNSPIPAEYFFIELLTALACCSIFVINGISEKSFLMSFTLLGNILCFLINTKHGRIPEKSLWIAFVATVAFLFFSLKFQGSVLFILTTHALIGFLFALALQKATQKQLPEGYTPMFALLAMCQTQGLSVLIFTVFGIFIAIFGRKIPLKFFISGIILTFSVFMSLDVSLPFLELKL